MTINWLWLVSPLNSSPEIIGANSVTNVRGGVNFDTEQVGIGGALIMEVDQGAPVGPVGFMSDSWRALFQHVHHEAGRLGLEINLNNDAGWNGSGGPWIKPGQSMQQVVWSETNVAGPARFQGVLPQPKTVAGFYREITVYAFPATGAYRIDRIKGKAAYEVESVGDIGRETLGAEMVIDQGKMIALAGLMDGSGAISWDVPAGEWTLVRFGHTSTGAENAPAPASGRGLECDKLSATGIEASFDGMMAKLAADTAQLQEKSKLVQESMAALEAQRLQASRQELIQRIARAVPEDGNVEPLDGLHLFQRLRQRRVSAARAVLLERMRGRGKRERHEDLAAGHDYFSASSSSSTFAGVRFSW